MSNLNGIKPEDWQVWQHLVLLVFIHQIR